MTNRIIQDQGHTFAPFLSDIKIDHKVHKLAKELEKDYPDGLVLCPVLSGAFIFTSDLVRDINVPVKFNFIKYSSYQGTESTNVLIAELPFNPARIQNKDIMIVEDIVDSGFTTDKLRKIALDLGARSVKICTFLFRPRAFKGQQRPEYVGYNLPDDTGFVIGYGMDLDERYRELPEIWAETL